MPKPEEAITDLYEHLLGRKPADKELHDWVAELERTNFEALFYKFIGSNEYRRRRRVNSLFPAGHFHSAVVDPDTVRDYVEWSAAQPIEGIDLPLTAMDAFYQRHLQLFRSTHLPARPTKNQRYHLDGSPFPHDDALILRAMLVEHKPRTLLRSDPASRQRRCSTRARSLIWISR